MADQVTSSDGRQSSEHYPLAEDVQYNSLVEDENDEDEFGEDISESLEYMLPIHGVSLMSPRSGGPGNLSLLSNDDSDFAGISPGAGLTTDFNDSESYDNNNLVGARYFRSNSGDKTPMANNRSFRTEYDSNLSLNDEVIREVDTKQNYGNVQDLGCNHLEPSYLSHLSFHGDGKKSDSSLDNEEEGSMSLRDQGKARRKARTGTTPRRRTKSIDGSDRARSPVTPKLSPQQELQRQYLNHLTMTPAGVASPKDFVGNHPERQNLSHLIMTPTMSGTREVPFRPSYSLPLRSPGATTASLSYSTEPSIEHNLSMGGHGDTESSVSFASPPPMYSPQRRPPVFRLHADSTTRSSNHTRESTNSLSANTIESETTRFHSGVEREFRKEAFRRNQPPQNREAVEQDLDAVSSDGSEPSLEPMVVCGLTCSMWLTRLLHNPFNLYRISLRVVEYSPCFWFWCCKRSELQGNASSDRFILARLNTISFFFTMIQLAAAAWLATVLFWITKEGAAGGFSPHLWNCNGAAFSIGLIGAVIMVMCFCTVRIIKEVDLVGTIRYLWSLLWIFPMEIFFNITLFDYHQVTEVWVTHWWGARQLSWFRSNNCLDGTADTLCVVPIDGGPDYETEDDWCQALYNSSECTEVRDAAQKATTFWLLMFYTSLATWGCIFMFLMLLVINTLERIISKPIVQKSREINVPGWLTFPTAATALVGTIFLFAPSSLLRTLKEHEWVGILYVTTSGLFLIALLTSWCLSSFSIRSNADKRRKGTAVVIFIGVMGLNASLLATLFVTSLLSSTQVNLNDSQRGDIACLISDSDCTNCDAALFSNRCPEWSVTDVTRILQTQLKQSASLAAIFFLYALNVMSYGINLRKHLSQYQIDYV